MPSTSDIDIPGAVIVATQKNEYKTVIPFPDDNQEGHKKFITKKVLKLPQKQIQLDENVFNDYISGYFYRGHIAEKKVIYFCEIVYRSIESSYSYISKLQLKEISTLYLFVIVYNQTPPQSWLKLNMCIILVLEGFIEFVTIIAQLISITGNTCFRRKLNSFHGWTLHL